jgi:hypothetical protein
MNTFVLHPLHVIIFSGALSLIGKNLASTVPVTNYSQLELSTFREAGNSLVCHHFHALNAAPLSPPFPTIHRPATNPRPESLPEDGSVTLFALFEQDIFLTYPLE